MKIEDIENIEELESLFCNCLSLEQNIEMYQVIEHIRSEYGVDIGFEDFISDAVDELLINLRDKGVQWYLSASPALSDERESIMDLLAKN